MIFKNSLKAIVLKNQKKLLFSYSLSNNYDSSNKQSTIIQQLFDSEEVIKQKIEQLAQLINKSKHPIFFTGAGISTSTGIPDYRSHTNTVVSTGPGLWNRSEQQLSNMHNNKKAIQNTVDKANPSLTHMAILTLIEKNIFKYVVSQNTDGLHLRSGVKKQFLSELHGNRNLQRCKKCQKKYLRDFRTLKPTQKQFKPGQIRQHETGRKCQNCDGDLHDSIIYFGQKLPKQQLQSAYIKAAQSDLCLVIGSSLSVKPSSNIPLFPLKYHPQGKLCIINIQQTRLDQFSHLRINGFCDLVMQKLMETLKLQIYPFKVVHYFKINIQDNLNYKTIKIFQKDQNYDNFTFIKNASLYINSQPFNLMSQNLKSERKQHEKCQSFILLNSLRSQMKECHILFQFYGNKKPYKLFINQFMDKKQVKLKIISQNNSQWQLSVLQ